MKSTEVHRFDPPNMYFELNAETQEPILASRRLIVHGQHFVELTDEIVCKVQFTETESAAVVAVYINNHTVAFEAPAPPAGTVLPLVSPIEISFNQGQQYTTSVANFYYTP